MSRHEVQRYSKIIEMPPLDGGSTEEPRLPEEDQHQEEGLTNGNTAASKRRRWSEAHFKKRVCNTFIQDSSRDGQCQCGRPRDTHPTHINTAVDTKWTTELHSSEQPTDAFGFQLQIEGDSLHRSFLRLSSDTAPSRVYNMMTSKNIQDGGWGLDPPALVVSVVGGDGSAEVKPWVQEVIRLVKPLQKRGAWILTEGFDEGLGRCVGEAVKGKFHAVGITPWGFVHNKDQLVNSQGSGDLNPAQYSVGNKTSDSCCLEKNHERFLLVDDGSEGRKGGEKIFRVKFEEHLSTQHIRDSSSITIPVLCMLISGEPSMLERVDLSLKNSTPWLVLAGSGGVADLLSEMLENQSPASAGDDVDRVTELVKKHFPSEAQTDQLVKLVQSICQNRKLITFYHEDQERPEDFDLVMIKALMPASKHRSSGNTFPYSKELILAMRWNRENFASSQLFNNDIGDDDINWTEENLMDCMVYALANNQFQLICQLIEKKKYLRTDGVGGLKYNLIYGFLEKLYSRVDKDTLVYRLLLGRLKERLGETDSLTKISLFEVSHVLKRLVGVKRFYFAALGLDDFISHTMVLERAKELLKDHEYRNHPHESPWTHLFIWAVLQNHSDLAVFFWGKAEEPVLNALSACKILKEMSKMEYETETKHSLEKLSLKFENLAHDVLGSCYQSDGVKSAHLLSLDSPVWGTNCVQMAIAAESLLFFNHDGLESSLSRVWWGPMERETPVWKFLLTFFCPLLLYTNLITFKDSDPDVPGWKKCFLMFSSFWRAPITTFTSNAVMYLLFLFLFAYVLLVDFKPPPPSGPSIPECVLYFWVFTVLSEEIRQAFSEGKKYMTICQRICLYWQDFWNKFDLIAIILFIIGLICRMFEWTYEFGRGVLCIDYMVFTLRLIHISAIHKEMGPKIIIVGKMMKDVAFFLFFLEVWVMAYGVANQALLYSYDSNLIRIFRRVFYRPYLYIFGEFHLEEIDVTQQWDMNCTTNMTLIDDGYEPCRSEYNNWLVIILLVVFLLVTNILLINLLIAIISNTFNKVEEKSEIYWRFQRYNLVMEYRSRPALPPPFLILSELRRVFFFLIRRCGAAPSRPGTPGEQQSCRNHKPSLWVGIFERQRTYRPEDFKNWVTEQKQNFLKAQSETERSCDSERIKQISDKVDKMEKRQQKQLQQLTEQLTKTTVIMEQRQRALETKVENALSQILDTLAKAPWATPPST